MRAFFRFALLSLILLAVALISALTAMRVAIHGREVTVPALIGMTPAQAERSANEHGLTVRVANEFYSDTVAEGRILSQSPEAGAVVRRSWQVQLARSLGPRHLQVPDVVGQSQRAAEINLRRRGLDVVTVAQARLPGEPQDEVIAQTPSANSSEIASPQAGILLALPGDTPAFVMPNFAGKTLAQAVRALQDAGLKVGQVTTAGTETPAGGSTPAIVLRQSIAAGQKVFPGASVNLEVGHPAASAPGPAN